MGELAVSPKAEGVAVGIDEIGEGLEFSPLLLVMPVLELRRVGALSRGLDLDETDQRAVSRDREIGTDHQVGQPRLTHKLGILGSQAAQYGYRFDEGHEGRAKLLLGLADDGGVAQGRLGGDAKLRNRLGQLICRVGQGHGDGFDLPVGDQVDHTSLKPGESAMIGSSYCG